MNKSLIQMAEVNTVLATALEQYKFSESMPVDFRQSNAGPSGTEQYMHPQRQAIVQSPSVSSLRDTGSEYSWHARIWGNAGGADGGAEDVVAGGADGGAEDVVAGGADGGAAGGADGGAASGVDWGVPSAPPDPPPSDHGGNGGTHMSRWQPRIRELEFAKLIKIKEPINFFGNAGDDFDTWRIFVQVYIEDQLEKFPKDMRTIDCIESLMKSYAASWHIQWIKRTLSGAYPESMTGYVNALRLRFEDKDAKDEAYADTEKVRYEGSIQDMFTKFQTFNEQAMVTGAALQKMILERLRQKILEQMLTLDLPGNMDQDIITIITNAGRTAEKLDAARKNLGLKRAMKTYEKKYSKLERPRDDSDKFERRKFKKDWKEWKQFKTTKSERRSRQDTSKTEGIEASEIDRRKAVGESLWCAWPSDRKGSHRVKDCIRPIKLDKGMASYPKAKGYRKMNVAGMELSSEEDDSSDSSAEEDTDSEHEESEEEDLEGEYFEEQTTDKETEEEEIEGNWWNSPPNSD
jgi:hypothetical protein